MSYDVQGTNLDSLDFSSMTLEELKGWKTAIEEKRLDLQFEMEEDDIDDLYTTETFEHYETVEETILLHIERKEKG